MCGQTNLFQTGHGPLNRGVALAVPQHMKLPRTAPSIPLQRDRDANPRRDHVVARTWAGDRVELRPLERGEAEPVLAVFAGMSLASRADRYLVGMSSLPPAMLKALTAVDGYDHAAWLASTRRRPAGIARYVRVGPGVAEIAFEVADDYQDRGLGTALLDTITTVACAGGVRRVRGTVLASNVRSQRLLGRVGIRLTPGDGVLDGEGRLRLLYPPRVDRSAVLALACAQSGTETLEGQCA